GFFFRNMKAYHGCQLHTMILPIGWQGTACPLNSHLEMSHSLLQGVYCGNLFEGYGSIEDEN
ncbi:MAG TPA: hypothetical protein VF354_06475, partial [Candidatus Methanoperedens sp.]